MPLRKLALTAGLAAALASPAFARPMTIPDLLEVDRVTEVAVSPGGEFVAYTIADPRNVLAGEKDGAPDRHLWIAHGPEAARAFVTGEVGVGRIAWSADGASVFFTARRAGDEHEKVYEIAAGGGEARAIVDHPGGLAAYAVSPDRRFAYFVAQAPADPGQKALAERGFRAVDYEDGLKPAHLWRVDLAAADAAPTTLSTLGHFSDLALSPDGTRIAAAVAPTPSTDDSLMRRQIHVFEAATGRLVSKVDLPGKLGGFAWSPSGDAIAFHAAVDIHDPSEGVLWIADAASGAARALTPDALQHVVDVDWLSDGEILATAHRGVESALVVYDRAGAELRTLPTSPDLVVRSVDIAGDRIAFAADGPTHAPALFAFGEDGAASRWIDPNPWFAELALAPQTTYTYQSRDGRSVEGLLITPEGRMPRGGWPLILVVHGGPEAHYSDGWLTGYALPGQIAAARGFATFHPNYLGSTGRGVQWTKDHQGDYAGREFDDLVDGVEALVADGLVNRAKVGITGGSYGGYASAWGATAQSAHFAAAVSFVPVTNQLSQSGTTDIPDEKYLVHARKRPWEGDWMFLLERSPIFHAGESRTPTLILHGADDPRVHPSQSLELYRHLKLRSAAPVRLVLYPGEGHGNRRAAAQHDYALRMMQWMEHYLTGPGGEPPPFDLDPALLGAKAE